MFFKTSVQKRVHSIGPRFARTILPNGSLNADFLTAFITSKLDHFLAAKIGTER